MNNLNPKDYYGRDQETIQCKLFSPVIMEEEI